MTISERILNIMKERGMTQMELVSKTGISQSSISDWKRKGTNPSADKIVVICQALGITPNELFDDTESFEQRSGTDYMVVREGTEQYTILVEYNSLKRKDKIKFMEYLFKLKGT